MNTDLVNEPHLLAERFASARHRWLCAPANVAHSAPTDQLSVCLDASTAHSLRPDLLGRRLHIITSTLVWRAILGTGRPKQHDGNHIQKVVGVLQTALTVLRKLEHAQGCSSIIVLGCIGAGARQSSSRRTIRILY
jgi:hypothetical protein